MAQKYPSLTHQPPSHTYRMSNRCADSAHSWTAIVSVRGKRRHVPVLPERWSRILLSLPADIWITIFEALAWAANYDWAQCRTSPIMVISAVCRYWRHLALTSPALWSRIHIPLTPTSYRAWNIGVLLRHLKLSGNALLDIFFDGQFKVKDLDQLHSRCFTMDWLEQPDGVDVWKRRTRDEETLTYEVGTYFIHTDCQDWEMMPQWRYRDVWKQLIQHTNRIRTLRICLQGTLSHPQIELDIGHGSTHFPELLSADISIVNGNTGWQCVYWPTSRFHVPKLRNLKLHNLQAFAYSEWPTDDADEHIPGWSAQLPIHASLSGHRNLTSLSICPIVLRTNVSKWFEANSDATLQFLALEFICIDDSGDRGETSYKPARSIVKKLFMKLDAPRLIGTDIRGSFPLNDFVNYLLMCSTDTTLCNVSFVWQIRLMGDLHRRDGLLSLMFQVMPEVKRASFYGSICQHFTEAVQLHAAEYYSQNIDDGPDSNRRKGSFWPYLDDLSLHDAKANDEAITRHLLLDRRRVSGSFLRRLYISLAPDHRHNTSRQTNLRIAEQEVMYEDWEEDADAWPWAER